MSKPYKGFIQTIPLKGPRKVCRLHFFLVLSLKGFLLCVLVLATRKQVNKLFQSYLVCDLIRCQLVSDILCYLLLISSHCIHIISSGPKVSISILIFQICMPIKYHQTTFSFQIPYNL